MRERIKDTKSAGVGECEIKVKRLRFSVNTVEQQRKMKYQKASEWREMEREREEREERGERKSM